MIDTKRFGAVSFQRGCDRGRRSGLTIHCARNEPGRNRFRRAQDGHARVQPTIQIEVPGWSQHQVLHLRLRIRDELRGNPCPCKFAVPNVPTAHRERLVCSRIFRVRHGKEIMLFIVRLSIFRGRIQAGGIEGDRTAFFERGQGQSPRL